MFFNSIFDPAIGLWILSFDVIVLVNNSNRIIIQYVLLEHVLVSARNVFNYKIFKSQPDTEKSPQKNPFVIHVQHSIRKAHLMLIMWPCCVIPRAVQRKSMQRGITYFNILLIIYEMLNYLTHTLSGLDYIDFFSFSVNSTVPKPDKLCNRYSCVW